MRSVIFGIDGATFRVLDRYRSELPMIDRLLSDGYNSELNSSLPATTSVAWPAMTTGQNPAKFGLADFMYRDPGTMEFELNDARRKSFDFFWQYMDESIGLGSIPIVPYHDVDGFFIQGSLAHVDADRVVSPPKLGGMIPSGYDYAIDWRDGPEKLLAGLQDRVEAREAVFSNLLETYNLPLYFFVFDAIDRIQHHFWAYMDEDHPNHAKSDYEDAILQVHKRVDAAIENLLKRFDEQVNVILVSDHGFKPSHTEINVNAILRQESYLSLNLNEVDGLVSRIADIAKRELGRETINRLVPKRLQQTAATQIPSHEQIGDVIEWEQTSAYGFGVMANIFINLEGREKLGTVPQPEYNRVCNEVAETLESVIDPKTGKSPIDILRKQDVYEGPYLDYVPDLVVQTGTGYKPISGVGTDVFHRKDGAMPNSGVHEREGIFVASGPAFLDRGRQQEANDIVDIAPTLLHMYGYPVPADMDGEVVTDALSNPGMVEHRKISKGEHQRIRDRVLSLKQLGGI